MKKIIQATEPIAIAASGLAEAVMTQASISTEKDIIDLLGEQNEIKDSIGRDGRYNESS